ncbi:hypothetical protein SAMN00017405_1113 [Desulfonispora thiosulfatigenes DSM 11270]|uniref:Uncharacterized protein n=1 Tax=Desulfonispora thiosulfatigenes DSM 11270 TaxID=656914 RepID=A0A1W1UYL2_DESTI|nr:hypothetical protein SAMN00017405_1113 [Desulfonispora thiosulfatigenes DSM 11270]
MMSKKMDIAIAFGLTIFKLILWAYKMLITSDIPVKMSFMDSLLITGLLLLTFIIYGFYITKTKFIKLNIILLALPLLLWFTCTQQSLTYHYHKYDTIVSIIGFTTILVSFLQLLYLKKKKIFIKR